MEFLLRIVVEIFVIVAVIAAIYYFRMKGNDEKLPEHVAQKLAEQEAIPTTKQIEEVDNSDDLPVDEKIAILEKMYDFFKN
ncbi:hypothetical protein [Carp edema virus]|nr:hypothetical protein [Carp edema virus]